MKRFRPTGLVQFMFFVSCLFLSGLGVGGLPGIAGAQDTATPYVLSTNPADGATGVDVNIRSVSVVFSEPMSESCSYSSTDFWGIGGPLWSSDKRTLTIPNYSTDPIPTGATVKFTLGTGITFKDVAGNLLRCPGFEPGTYEFSIMAGTFVDAIPYVVSTVPANGETSVSRDLASVVINFSEPMDDCCVNMTSNFPASTSSWSKDHTRLTLTRVDLEARLSGGVTYGFNLNPGEGYYIRDTQGNYLPATSFSFTIAQEYDYTLTKVPANAAKGFHWPYYLSVPNQLNSPTTLLVEPNNTGTWSDDQAVHDAAALNLVRQRSDFAITLGVPLLVPTFPRPITPPAPEPGGIYTHALDRYTLLTDAVVNGGSIERIDLQLIAMIRDAQERVKGMGYVLDSKVFMMGFSASGAFTSRFTVLHPEIVRAAAPGSPGGWPLAPVANWQGTRLGYAVGVADNTALVGQPFDLASFRKVPQYIYVGDLDRNDALDTRGLPDAEKNAICALLDCRPEPYISDRWPIAEAIYDSVQADAQFVIYPGVGHGITDQMFNDVKNFFTSHKTTHVPGRAHPSINILLLDE
jgi:hypothetical protein